MKVWNSLVKVNIYLNSKYSTVAIAVDKPLIILVWRLKDQSKHIFKNWYKSIAKNKKQFKMGKGPEETFFFSKEDVQQVNRNMKSFQHH